MDISDIANRAIPPEPWAEGEKIPWNEPGFSERMLREHLSQDHDAASRRIEIVHQQVDYIERLLGDKTGARALDLACGPGLHSLELARRGLGTLGIDFSPTSIEWAKSTASSESLACEFVYGDIRTADYGSEFNVAMLLFGEMNVFSIADFRIVLRKTREALVDGGVLLLEPHEPGVIHTNFESPPTWTAHESGLFSDRPHVLLEEGFWHGDVQMAVKRWYVVDSETGEVTAYSQTVVDYSRFELAHLVEAEGFTVSEATYSAAETWPDGSHGQTAEFYPLVAIAK